MNIADILAMLQGRGPVEQAQQAVMADSGGAGGAPAGPQPGPQPQPNAPPPPQPPSSATQSPPDLSAMYLDMMKDAQRKEQVNSGLTLMAAGLTPYEDTRQSLIQLSSQGGGGGGGGMSSVFNTLDSIRKTTDELAQKQKMRAILPTLAKQHGLSIETITAMFEGGQLEEFLKEAANPETSVITKPDGSQVLINSDTGAEIKIVGPAKPRETDYIDDPSGKGGKILVYKDDKTPVVGGKPVSSIAAPPRKIKMIDDPAGTGGQIAVYEDDNTRVDTGEPVTTIKPQPKQKRIEKLADGRLQAFDDEGKPIGEPVGPETPVTTDDIDEFEYAVKQGYKGNLENWIISGKNAASTKIDLGLGKGKLEEELAKGTAGQYTEEYTAARGASETIASIGTARQQLEQGIIAGNMFSPLELAGRKTIASIFGVPDEATTNTETFQAALKEVVLGKIKALGAGSGISNTDREFVEKAVGGSIEMNPASMKRILGILEKGARTKIQNYNKEVESLVATYPAEKQVEIRRMLRNVEEPPALKTLSLEERLEKYRKK